MSSASGVGDWGGDARFHGAWSLQSFTERDAGGGNDETFPYGADARGSIVYSPCGVVSYQLCAGPAARPCFASGDFMRGTQAELAAAAASFRSYVANWRADAAAGVVTHDVQLSFHSNREGVRLRRSYEFRAGGDELVLVPLAADASPGAGTRREELVWRRVR